MGTIDNSNDMEKIFTALSAKKADLIILILASQNIKTAIEKQNSLFNVLVDKKNQKQAFLTVDTYYKENKFFRLKKQLQAFPISSFKSYTAFIIMGLLVVIHTLCTYYNVHEKMILKYGASALFILQGETYRAITALFLHADVQHLAGNLAGMLIFAAPVISVSGYGTGSLMLLASGTLGNLFNAHMYQTAHLSIGASTAVMGAAGLLAAFQITQRQRAVSLNNLMPIFAGAVLVALFSQGEHTDVWAHIFGFFSGLCLGILFFPFNRFIQSYLKEPIALIITIIILLASL
ncbi:MAG: rhomboid family intramembrane serine protease [Desulfobacula sp.]|nr:rhomboid family intramembrane serine protease [Desulfobacula sp.]